MPVLLDTERKITDSGLKRIGSGLQPTGTVLLSSRAPIGYLAINEIPVAINQGFIAIRPRQDISNLFLLYWCKYFLDEIVNHANGSTFLEISKSNFRQIPLVVPSQPVLDAYHLLVSNWYARMVLNERSSRPWPPSGTRCCRGWCLGSCRWGKRTWLIGCRYNDPKLTNGAAFPGSHQGGCG